MAPQAGTVVPSLHERHCCRRALFRCRLASLPLSFPFVGWLTGRVWRLIGDGSPVSTRRRRLGEAHDRGRLLGAGAAVAASRARGAAVVRFLPGHDPPEAVGMTPAMPLMSAESLAPVSVRGQSQAVAAVLPGPVAIAPSTVVSSLPVWTTWRWLARHGRPGTAAGRLCDRRAGTYCCARSCLRMIAVLSMVITFSPF